MQVANQELVMLTLFPLHSSKVASKDWVTTSIVMFWGWLPCYLEFVFLNQGENALLRWKLRYICVLELQGLVKYAFEKSIKCSAEAFRCSSLCVYNLTLNKFTLERKACTNVSISPWISALAETFPGHLQEAWENFSRPPPPSFFEVSFPPTLSRSSLASDNYSIIVGGKNTSSKTKVLVRGTMDGHSPFKFLFKFDRIFWKWS